MGSLIASALGFAAGLLLLPVMIRGVRVGGLGGALKAGVVCGILSAVLGKLLVALLTLFFLLPVLLTGPVGAFAVQALVNAILLAMAGRLVEGVQFDRRRTLLWASFALTLLQTAARLLV